MAVLHVSLLGGFRLTYGDRSITSANTARVQELLAYLVLHTGPQSRQHLAFLLWPDSNEVQARTNLRHLWHLLRQALPDCDRFLTSDFYHMAWRVDASFTLDVMEFREGVARAVTALDLEAALRLYRGDLLPACYADWVLPEREQLRQEFMQAVERAIAAFEEQLDDEAALAYARRLLIEDPLREETYRTLMRLSAQVGNRAGVTHFFEVCKNVLKRELDVEPSAVTRAAYVRYRDMEPVRPKGDRPPTPAGRKHNLPVQLTTLIGRERERRQVVELLSAPNVELDECWARPRLLTLTGPAGVGKTRLALAAAADLIDCFQDGVWFIDAARLSDPAFLSQAVLMAIGRRSLPGEAPLETLSDFLADRQILLVLDNCEHLLDSARNVARATLQAAPELRILATSRITIGVPGELVWQVPPLPVPGEGETAYEALRQNESVQLWTSRAVALLPTFRLTPANAPTIGYICSRLDGLPLALELAAGRITFLSVTQIAERLSDALHLLSQAGSAGPPHHRTLRATLDWSHDLLSEPERILFRRLTVFTGGFELEAVEAICADEGMANDSAGQSSRKGLPVRTVEVLDLLSGLVDGSLVKVEARGGRRRLGLHEMVRQYAREKLEEAGEAEAMQARHLWYFLNLAQELDRALQGGTGQSAALAQLQDEHDNFHAAFEACLGNPDRTEAGLSLVGALNGLWDWLGYVAQGRSWLDRLLQQPSVVRPAVLARALLAAANAAYLQSDYEAALPLYRRCLELYRESGDADGAAHTLVRMGALEGSRCAYAESRPMLEEAVAIFLELGDLAGATLAQIYLGRIVYELGEPALARQLLEAALMSCCRLDAPAFVSMCNYFLGDIARQDGNMALARARYSESLRVGRVFGLSSKLIYCLEGICLIDAKEGRLERAARLLGAVEALVKSTGASLVPIVETQHMEIKARLMKEWGQRCLAERMKEGESMPIEQTISYALKTDASKGLSAPR